MLQLKTMGNSALLLLMLCLTSTTGFLETDRRQQNKNYQLNNRNFFGNTWQRSSEIKEERRSVPDFRRSTDDRDYRRQIRDSRLFSATSPADSRRSTSYGEDRRLSPLETRDYRQEARLFENRRSVYSRRQISAGREDNNRRREIRSISLNRQQTREQERRILAARQDNSRRNFREQNRQSRQLDNSIDKREIRSSIGESREDNSRQVREDIRARRNVDVSRQQSRRIAVDRENGNRHLIREQERLSATREDNTQREIRSNSRRTDDRQTRQQFRERREIRSSPLDRSREDNNSRRQFRQDNSATSRREIRQVREDNSRRTSVAREDDRQSRQLDNFRGDIRTQERREFPERRDIRLSTLGRSREDNSRRVSADRQDDRQSRQLENSRRGYFERLEIRLASVDRTRDNSRRFSTSRLDNRESRRIAVERREIRSSSLDRYLGDNSRQIRDSRDRQSRTMDNSRRISQDERRNRLSDQEIRVLDRRLTKEVERSSRVASVRREMATLSRDSRVKRDSRLVSDATRRIAASNLSSKEENNNDRRFDTYEPSRVVERDSRQSRTAERRMATSFKPMEDIEYIPELKSNLLLNAAKVVLISLLIAQVASNSSKSKKNWFHSLTNFVTVTKEKVL